MPAVVETPNQLVDISSEESHQAEGGGLSVFLAQGSPEAADWYRKAKRAAAAMVTDAKTQVWEFREAMMTFGRPQGRYLKIFGLKFLL